MSATTIFSARLIRTMNPARPVATHVAVRDGRILGAGSLGELAGWGAYSLDERFADKVLMPGFVEAHSHLLEGALWRFVYVGLHDRLDPDGRLWRGAPSIAAVVQRLAGEEARLAGPEQALVGWGLDPIHFGGRRVGREDLDRVSATRPVAVLPPACTSSMPTPPHWLRPATFDRAFAIRACPWPATGCPTASAKGRMPWRRWPQRSASTAAFLRPTAKPCAPSPGSASGRA